MNWGEGIREEIVGSGDILFHGLKEISLKSDFVLSFHWPDHYGPTFRCWDKLLAGYRFFPGGVECANLPFVDLLLEASPKL